MLEIIIEIISELDITITSLALGMEGVFQELAESMGAHVRKVEETGLLRSGHVCWKLALVRRLFLSVQKPCVGTGFDQPRGTIVSRG